MKSKSTTTANPKRRRGRRGPRPRPIPRWLTGREDLDQIAQRRCLLVLSVLSGEKPVTTAITELGISRPLYYQLETKAIVAMLTALAPGASSAESPNEATPAHQVATLEARVAALEQDKRRLERLLFLTRKIVPPGPIAMPSKRGRPTGSRNRASTNAGLEPLPSSTTSTRAATTSTSTSSIPTTDGATKP
jgi:hypothetical protein